MISTFARYSDAWTKDLRLECRLLQRLNLGHCDGTLDLVDEWGCERDIDVDSLLALMEGRGGFCDCEVLLNVLFRGRLVVEDLVLSCGAP